MIQMIGIDFTTASVDTRSAFAFRKSEIPGIMNQIKEDMGLSGIIMLSTCNRMEVWASSKKRMDGLLDILCASAALDPEEYRSSFVERQGDEAARHLFLLTSGLKSAIVAEDQILSQVKDAADIARVNNLIDSPLEVLFRLAVTAGKRIKTEVVFHRGNSTAIEKAIKLVEEKYFKLSGRKVMVIGNGEYGRLAANKLISAGADVTVTIRQYHSGEVRIPEGAKTILYGDKYLYFPQCDMIVSATASPNYTLFYDKVAECENNGTKILIDLAVPRDIDPEIAKLQGYHLYDIDDFQTDLGAENVEAMKQAQDIIEEVLEEYRVWTSFRDIIPMIKRIGEEASKDVLGRLEKPLQKLSSSEEEKQALKERIADASGKVVANLFYEFRDCLDEEVFRSCVLTADSMYRESGE